MNNLKGKTSDASGAANRMSVEQFADRLDAIMRRMTEAIISVERNYLARGIITVPQFWVLGHITAAAACPMNSISRSLNIKAPTVTGIVDRLVKLGLVKRYASESDRRGVLAEATPKGRRILNDIRSARRRMVIEAFGPLSHRERAFYLAIHEKVAAQLAARKQSNA